MKLKFLTIVLLSYFGQQNCTEINKIQMFKQKLNQLITRNVVWARSYIISSLSDLPDKDAIKQRLLQNQGKFKELLEQSFGVEQGKKLVSLLEEHKSFTVQLIDLVKSNSKGLTKKIELKWYKNIKDLAIFINKLNPKLTVNFLTKTFNKLLKLTKQEIIFRHKKQWKEDIENFDEILNYANEMAENLATAFLK